MMASERKDPAHKEPGELHTPTRIPDTVFQGFRCATSTDMPGQAGQLALACEGAATYAAGHELWPSEQSTNACTAMEPSARPLETEGSRLR